MAITFVGRASGSEVGGSGSDVTLDLTSLSGGSGSSAAEDDLVLVAGAARTTETSISTSGYTQIDLLDNGAWDHILEYKIMGASPDTTVVGTNTSNTSHTSVYMAYVYRGVDTTTPLDATTTREYYDNGVFNRDEPDPPAITTVTDGARVASVVLFSRNNADIAVSTYPSGYGNTGTVNELGAQVRNGIGIADTTVASAGTETPGNWFLTVVAGDWTAYTVALRPGVTGPADLVAEQGSYILTGQAATLSKVITLVADQGSYTLTGQAADLLWAQSIVAAQGSYTLSGQTVDLSKNYPLAVDQGSYILGGQEAALLIARSIVANQGSYVLNGQEANLEWMRYLLANPGAYVLTGQDAPVIRTYPLEAEQGSYTLTGNDVAFDVVKTLTAAVGNYTVNGQDSTLLEDLLMTAEQGSYALTGNDADLLYITVIPDLVAEQGSYTLTGYEADLTFIEYNPGRFNQWYTTISITLGIT